LARWPPLWQIDCEVENERERERCEVFICARRYTVTSSRAAEWSKERRCFVHERERERERKREEKAEFKRLSPKFVIGLLVLLCTL
jgi:hypothetical protein